MFLADTTAWIWSRRHGYPDLRERFDAYLEAGEIATCDLVRLELLAGVPSSQYDARARDLEALESAPIGGRVWERALEVQAELAGRTADGHRGVVAPDLLIAAAAESAGLELLHYDADFGRIAEATRQPSHWLAPPGTLR